MIYLKNSHIIYIVQQITDKSISKRNNEKCLSPAGLNKSTGIISLIQNSEYKVTVLSPSFVNNRTGKIYKNFHEKYHGYDLYHSLIWDIPLINILTCILWISNEVFKKRKEYNKILFYNYRPETAIPAFFAKIFLKKKIYLEYEDGYFALDIFKPLKWTIALIEMIGDRLISGAILVTEKLESRVATKNIQIIPGIIDQELFDYFNELPPKSDPTKVIMFAGGLDEIRGINIFLEIAEKIINKIDSNYEFRITGKGSLEPVVHDYVKKYPDKIFYYGFVSRDHLLKLYEHVDAFVSLQKPEYEFSTASSPSKVFEFISTGKICIGLIDLKINTENYIYAEDFNSLEKLLIDIINGSIRKSPLIYQSDLHICIFNSISSIS